MAKPKKDKSDGITPPLFSPNSNWKCPDSFPDLTNETIIAIDCETKDLDLRTRGPGFIRGDAYPVGVSISTGHGSWYFPTRHLGGGSLDPDAVATWLNDVLNVEGLMIVGANLQYDLEALWSMGVNIDDSKVTFWDVQVVEALIDEERDSYSLESLAYQYGLPPKNEEMLREAAAAFGVDPKSGLWKLPPIYVGAYAEYDAQVTYEIYRRQRDVIVRENLEQIVNLEMDLLPVIFQMRLRGIPINMDAASALSARLKEEEDAMRLSIIRDHGMEIDEWSGPSLAKICEKLNIEYPHTERGGPSFTGEWLEDHEHPVMQAASDLRQLNKMRQTFVDGWVHKNAIKGRIHPQWVQIASDEGGTRSGRMAAKNPNPQQIPAGKTRKGQPRPIGAAIRALFIPEPGMMWAKIDYSQQEPRVLCHYAAKCNLAGAEAAAFSYRSNPKMDWYQFMMDLAAINRRTAKDMFLGRCYGMGKNKLAQKIGKSVDEAARILADFDDKVPFVKELAEKCTVLAQRRGFIKTLAGRKRHFNYWEPSNSYQLRKEGKDTTPKRLPEAERAWPGAHLIRAETHKALNALIQGSAADMMKAGLIKGYKEDGRIPHITVHDEVGGSVEDEADALRWKKTMETCVDICVPILGDLSIGKNWR